MTYVKKKAKKMRYTCSCGKKWTTYSKQTKCPRPGCGKTASAVEIID